MRSWTILAASLAMCAGAAYWAGVGRVVYGLSERDLGALIGRHLGELLRRDRGHPCGGALRHRHAAHLSGHGVFPFAGLDVQGNRIGGPGSSARQESEG